MSKAKALTREFKYNGMTLPDLGGNLTPSQVKDAYANTYGDLTNAIVKGPDYTGDKEVYTFQTSVGTKG